MIPHEMSCPDRISALLIQHLILGPSYTHLLARIVVPCRMARLIQVLL